MSPLRLELEEGVLLSAIPKTPKKESELQTEKIVVRKIVGDKTTVTTLELNHAPNGGYLNAYQEATAYSWIEVIASEKRMEPLQKLPIKNSGVTVCSYSIVPE